MRYIIALDIGVASVGWVIIDIISGLVIESGTNIFPEASAANNQVRRSMRQGRRIKRRLKTRLNDFNKLWVSSGFEIPEKTLVEIVETKVKALKEPVSSEELYCILYNYLKHRGISYLEDASDDSVKGNSSYANGLRVNALELENKYPCQIQKERLEQIGSFRGMTQLVDANNEPVDLSNVFTSSAYRKEIMQILDTQKSIHTGLTAAFCDEYMMLFNRKRKYYEGPGNEKSRTDYGRFTTKVDENGNYITENNIFEKLIGKCSVYKEELRAASASYTAQEFNLLNDLNNLTVNGRKLSADEKKRIVDKIKTVKTVNMKNIISEAMGEKIQEFYGARVDKDEKEIFHKFEVYNKMRKVLSEVGFDITTYTRDELDEIGHIMTINTDKEALIEAFHLSSVNLDDPVRDCLISLRKSNGQLFSKWHSFSIKLMNELIPEMYEQPKEQMTLLTEMGVVGSQASYFKGFKYIPVDVATKDIINPVVRRSVRISLRILNALLKKYKNIDTVVIEMPRDNNSDEEKKRIKDAQNANKKEMEYIQKLLVESYNIRLKSADYSSQKQLKMKLKLWNEQDGICLYSGRKINPYDLINHPDMFEVDHIIPISISFDDSRSNKVLVYRSENQKKGNNTPYYYLTHSNSVWTFDQYKATVMCLSKKKEYPISRSKIKNLLYSEDITKIDVLKGFINRNLYDTRYASRVVLNTLQNFFKAREEHTKVKVLKGSFTHQMRVNLQLNKDREEYSHHAVDAMLIAYSMLGYESYRKLQGAFIDFETGEILDQRMWSENMTDKVYTDYIYGMKWLQIRNEIVRAEKEVKYWYYVDKKANRGLCNQTIYGTRTYDGVTYKINHFDIRTKNGIELFKKFALSDKDKDKNRLLVYRHDRKTFDELVSIYNDYADAANPFVQFEKETGDIVRKHSKRHNGPRIDKLKYIDGEVDTCVDISHKYGQAKGSKKVILESLVPFRMDVYYNKNTNSYHLIGVKQSDIKYENGKLMIDENAYSRILIKEKLIHNGQSRKDLVELGYEFCMSFFKNDIIEYEKDGKLYKERFLSRTKPNSRNYIETKPINKLKFEKQNLVGLGKTTYIVKYRMDILGNHYLCVKEEFSKYC